MTITAPAGTPGVTTFTPAQLLRTARLLARNPELPALIAQAPIDPESGRPWLRLDHTQQLEVWLLGWPPGTSTGWHDHGVSGGAFVVVQGSLTEHSTRKPDDAGRPGGSPVAVRTEHLAPQMGRAFSLRHVHDVVNNGVAYAVSVHAYAPALGAMTRYRLRDGRLHIVETAREGVDW